ncbi:hypothetical protein SCP_0405620 [Sparassis crispa]|uniref:Uncharacterized protein n=1 Tax=Sparassis crispa TaxID=139825 RepID=A0A401GJ36_9APHY|nr:hypothetical protein SCP_0405620 [Sparassis crispa]GBE82182.1 hypothetical protein SCP_0405620 [Sparassis crispa]
MDEVKWDIAAAMLVAGENKSDYAGGEGLYLVPAGSPGEGFPTQTLNDAPSSAAAQTYSLPHKTTIHFTLGAYHRWACGGITPLALAAVVLIVTPLRTVTQILTPIVTYDTPYTGEHYNKFIVMAHTAAVPYTPEPAVVAVSD